MIRPADPSRAWHGLALSLHPLVSGTLPRRDPDIFPSRNRRGAACRVDPPRGPTAPFCRASRPPRRSRSVQVSRSKTGERAGLSIARALIPLRIVSDILLRVLILEEFRAHEYICYLYYRNRAATRSNRTRVCSGRCFISQHVGKRYKREILILSFNIVDSARQYIFFRSSRKIKDR